MKENLVLYATETAFVVLNRYPFTAGHLLVVPKRHASDLSSLPDGEHDALFRLVRESAVAIAELTRDLDGMRGSSHPAAR